jgi:WD40 repeat protein
VIVKNYMNPSECFIYRGHSANPTVAKFSPNGFWIASGDAAGKVRVWSWDNPEHLTKLECPVFSGQIYDLDWDMESKKIVAAGDGSGQLVKCFNWDTGNSAGEMTGHAKRVLSVCHRSGRPFRVMTGSEDMRTCFYAGPPFKLDHSNSCHTNFVNCVRYSVNGDRLVSVSSDRKIQLYDGTTGEPNGDIPNAHEGGIYSASFSPDGSQFVTASADKTLKIWNSGSLALEQTLNPAVNPSDAQLGDMQVSVLWNKDNHIISISLNGNMNIFNRASGSSSSTTPDRVIHAHQVAITTMTYNRENNTLYSGSFDGVVVARQLEGNYEAMKLCGGDKKSLSNAIHNGKCVGIAILSSSQQYNIVSVGWDDKIRWGNTSSNQYSAEETLNGQPVALGNAPHSDLVVVLTNAEIVFYRSSTKVSSIANSTLSYVPTCCSMINENEIAIGGNDNRTHIYSLSSSYELKENQVIETRSPVSALSFSPSGNFLAIGDTGRQVEVYEKNGSTWNARIKGKWVNHTSRITCLSWSANSDRLASGSLDENIYIWSLTNKPNTFTYQIPFSHSGGLSGLQWMNDSQLVSVGNDHTTVTWKIPNSA